MSADRTPTDPGAGPSGEGTSPDAIALAPGVMLPRWCVRFAFTPSSGPGGQNVNKVATRAELRVRLADIPITEGARRRLAALAGSRVVGKGAEREIVIAAQSERSQKRNRDEAISRLSELVRRAIVPPTPRRKTKPTQGSVRRRIEEKKRRGEAKRRRQGEE